MGEHCVFANLFENIQTGQVLRDPAVQGGDQIGDVDVPQLDRPLCSPLTVPAGFNIFAAPGPGPIQLDGRFALSSTPGPQGGSETYLEKCGAHLKQLLQPSRPAQDAPPVASNRHALVWQATANRVVIEFLPSRLRYQVSVPKAVQGSLDPALTTRHLYLLQDGAPPSQNGRLWIAVKRH
ncbi:MAG: hypothetical protein ACYC0H_10120 [Solirubrobacteraceae bacterium]